MWRFSSLLPLIAIIPYVAYKRLTNVSVDNLGTNPNFIFITILAVIPAHILTFLVGLVCCLTERARSRFGLLLVGTGPGILAFGKRSA